MQWVTRISSLVVLSSYAVLGQPVEPAFEVASIKPADPAANGSSTRTSQGRLTMTNVTLKRCIQIAYRIQEYQVSGGPNWLDTARFDIVAKAADSDEKLPNTVRQERMEAMIRTLLGDRFQLAIHRETKLLPAYTLTVGKNGHKLKEAEPGEGSSTSSGRGKLTAKRVSMADLAIRLSSLMDRPVVDMTGVKGTFDLALEWTPDDAQPAAKPGGNEEVDKASGPSIFTAIQEQLGLRLEAQKAPVEKIVIDRAERPSEN
jgi:uncharacterized protein (TIGR03435 family)